MPSHIYILTDGMNTKIGVTNDLAKRMASYVTHNPNFTVYRTYATDDAEAKRVETAIKQIFKDKLSGKGKEWFEVPAPYIDRYVSVLILAPYEEHLTPAMHGVRLTSEAFEMKDKIVAVIAKTDKVSPDEYDATKYRLAEHFARCFGLGVPRHLRPENIVATDALVVDFEHCDRESEIVRRAVADNYIRMPYQDHYSSFYHLVKLSSGYYVALCTAEVSMPYRMAIEGKRQEIIDAASQVGWYATFHDEWSWHSPDETALVLFQQKSPVQQRLRSWDHSFRKWVIERSEILKQEKYGDPDRLEKTIGDIVGDSTFPMHARSYQEFFDDYLAQFWHLSDRDTFAYRNEYEFLLNKWNQGSVLRRE